MPVAAKDGSGKTGLVPACGLALASTFFCFFAAKLAQLSKLPYSPFTWSRVKINARTEGKGGVVEQSWCMSVIHTRNAQK